MISSTILSMIIPALVPAFADGFRKVIGYFTGDRMPTPQNVAEQVQLMTAETDKLRVIAELDRPSGTISQWVADLRSSFRYIAAGAIILSTITTAPLLLITPKEYLDIMYQVFQAELQMSGSVFSFMFGDKFYIYLKRGR